MLGKNLLKWVMLALNIAAILAMLFVLIGTVVSPNRVLFPAYFALGQPLIILFNAFFMLFWLLGRKWYFLLSLSVLLLSATQIRDTFPVHLKEKKFTAKDNAHTIEILSYNMMMSGKLVKHTRKHPNKVIQYILDKNADIVCLQEFMVSTKEEYLTHKDMLRIFKHYPYKYISYAKRYRSRLNGIATFSKYPILSKKRIKYQSEANLSICSDIVISGDTFRLFNNHLESNRITENEKTSSYRLKDKFDAGDLKNLTVHFSQKLGVAYQLRAAQADSVAAEITRSPYPVLVCGDFNDVPGSYTYTTVKGNLKDAYTETSTGFGWTFPQKLFGFRIDYVLYDSLRFMPVKFYSDKVKYSDHYPVSCHMKLRE